MEHELRVVFELFPLTPGINTSRLKGVDLST